MSKERLEVFKKKFPYTFFGIDSKAAGVNQQVADCPFCDKVDKFYIDEESGQYNCKVCGESGNVFTYLRFFYDELPVDKERLTKYAEFRGLTYETMNTFGYRFFPENSQWFYPIKNLSGEIISLRYIGKSKSVYKDYSIPGVHASIGSIETLKESTKIIWICEGVGDAQALYEMFVKEKMTDTNTVLWLAGANNFKDTWFEIFKDREVILCYDNDKAGLAARLKFGNTYMTAGLPEDALFYIDWTKVPKAPNKYDVRDHYINGATLNDFKDLIEVFPKEDFKDREENINELIAKFPHISERKMQWKDLVAILGKDYQLSTDLELGFKMLVANVHSLNIKDTTPNWQHLVSPAGCLSGQTEIEVNRAGKSFRLKLKDLFNRYNGFLSYTTEGRGNHSITWNKDIKTNIRSFDGKTIRLTEVVQVVKSGKKQVYTVITETGKKIRATLDHKFLTNKGWRRLEEFIEDNSITLAVEGKKGTLTQNIGKKNYKEISGLLFHPYGKWNLKHFTYGKVAYHRVVFEAVANGITLEEYIERLKTGNNLENLAFLPKEISVHHIDGNHLNNKPNNLTALTDKEHKQLHAKINYHHPTSHTVFESVQSIIKFKEIMTYDITVKSFENQEPNFLANKFVVHNSMKTELISAFEACSHVYILSNSSSKALVSGFQTKKGNDPSLIPKVIGKCLMIKDFTEILQMPRGDQEEMMGILRGAYDGYIVKTFGNGVVRKYDDCQFNLVTGVTRVIYSDNKAAMGERFLKFVMIQGNKFENIDEVLIKAIHQTGREKSIRANLQTVVKEFCEVKFDYTEIPELSSEDEKMLVGLARVLSSLRAEVQKIQGTEVLMYRPQIEYGTRPMKVMALNLRCLGMVNGADNDYQITEQDRAIVVRNAVSSMTPYCFDIARALYHAGKEGLTRKELCQVMKMESRSATVTHYLSNLEDVEFVEHYEGEKEDVLRPGPTPRYYKLSANALKLWKQSRIEDYTDGSPVNTEDLGKQKNRLKPGTIRVVKKVKKEAS